MNHDEHFKPGYPKAAGAEWLRDAIAKAGQTMKQYLGDGVYVEFDGYALVVTTENGIAVTNRVVLEPDVYSSLVQYVAGLKAKDKAEQEGS